MRRVSNDNGWGYIYTDTRAGTREIIERMCDEINELQDIVLKLQMQIDRLNNEVEKHEDNRVL